MCCLDRAVRGAPNETRRLRGLGDGGDERVRIRDGHDEHALRDRERGRQIDCLRSRMEAHDGEDAYVVDQMHRGSTRIDRVVAYDEPEGARLGVRLRSCPPSSRRSAAARELRCRCRSSGCRRSRRHRCAGTSSRTRKIVSSAASARPAIRPGRSSRPSRAERSARSLATERRFAPCGLRAGDVRLAQRGRRRARRDGRAGAHTEPKGRGDRERGADCDREGELASSRSGAANPCARGVGLTDGRREIVEESARRGGADPQAAVRSPSRGSPPTAPRRCPRAPAWGASRRTRRERGRSDHRRGTAARRSASP